LFKLTASGGVLESTNINDFEAKQIIIKDDNIGYLISVDDVAKEFNLHSVAINPTSVTFDGGFAFMSLDGTLHGDLFAKDRDEFTDAVPCRILNDGSLNINGIPYAPFTDQTFAHIVCDDDTYYYVTTIDSNDTMRLYKFDRDDDSKYEMVVMGGSPNATNAPFLSKEVVDGVLQTIVYWVGDMQVNRYSINHKGEMVLINTLYSENPFVNGVISDYSGYKLNKRITKRHNLNGRSYLKYSVILDVNGTLTKKVLTVDTKDLSSNWHFFSIVKNDDDDTIKLYIDAVLRGTLADTAYNISYRVENMVNIGGVSDGSDSLFRRLGVRGRCLDGGLSEFSILKTPLDASDINALYVSKFSADTTVNWVIDNGSKSFIEEIHRVFKFKKPGMKSQFFNIIVKNMNLSDDVKADYEEVIRSNISPMLPANVKLLKVIWR
jgi:hypothetical protein